jgi:MFS family permease
MALMGCGLLLFTQLTPETSYGFLIITMALIGIGLACNSGPVMTVVVGNVSATRAGLASGFGNVARMIGATLGVAVLGAIFAAHLANGHGTTAFMTGLHTAFLVGGCIELLGSVLAILYIPCMIAGARQTSSEEAVPVSAHS